MREAEAAHPATPTPQVVESTNMTFASSRPADYAAVQFILNNNLQTQAVDAYLGECHAQRSITFRRHLGFTVAPDTLDVAGHVVGVGSDEAAVAAHAAAIAAAACGARCGTSCRGCCRVAAAVQPSCGRSTTFYFGRHDDIFSAISAESIQVVYLADELRLKQDRDVDALLDSYMAVHREALDALQLKPVALVSAPGRVLWMCDIAAWLKFQLETAGRDGADVNMEPRYEALMVDGEQAVGRPHTSTWQRLYEEVVTDGLQSDEYLHGFGVAIDGANMDRATFAGSRKLDPGYVWCESFSKKARAMRKWYLPAFLMPQSSKRPAKETPKESEARSKVDRDALREAITILFARFDGVTRVPYVVNGTTRKAVFGLQSFIVDGLEMFLLDFLRQNGNRPCHRCLLPSELFHLFYHMDVPPQLARTNALELAHLELASSLMVPGSGTIGRGKEFIKSRGRHEECVVNPLSVVFGCNRMDWAVGRNFAYARLHTNDLGLGTEMVTLALQGVQRIRQSPEETAEALSAAAVDADQIYHELQRAVQTLVQHLPSSCTHARWHNFGYHWSRDEGERRPPSVYAKLRHCNAWHIRDLVKFLIPTLSLDFVFSESDVTGAQAFAHMSIETLGVYQVALAAQSTDVSTERHRAEMKILNREWTYSMLSAHGSTFTVNYKPHQSAAHQHESYKDLGTNMHTEQWSESAHKEQRLQYSLQTSHGRGFEAELARRRNRKLAGWFMCLEAGHDNQSSGNAREHEETSELSDPDRVNILTLTLDAKFKVVGLVRSPRSRRQRTALTTLTEPVVCGALLFRKLHQAFPLLMILTAC